MKVLIVEDDPTDLKLARSVLAAEGYEIAIARSAEQALQLLESIHPDVILTDLRLPEMDGVAFARRLKASSETATIPVVAMTAYADFFPKRKAERALIFHTSLHKPIDPDTLPALLLAAGTRRAGNSP